MGRGGSRQAGGAGSRCGLAWQSEGDARVSGGAGSLGIFTTRAFARACVHTYTKHTLQGPIVSNAFNVNLTLWGHLLLC